MLKFLSVQDLKSFEPRDILLIWLGRLGDFIASTPFLDSMRKRFPRSRIVLLTGRKGAEAAALDDSVDERWALEPWYRPLANAAVWSRLASRRFELAVDLNQSFSRGSGLLTLMTRAPVRVSFQKPRGGLFYTHTAPHDPLRDNIILSYGRLAALFGAPFSPRPRLQLRPEYEEAATALLRGLKPDPATAWLAVHPGNFKKFKNRWPEDKFIELTRRLMRPGLTIFYIAGPGEDKPVLKMLESLPGVLYLPPAPAAVSAAVLARMDLLLANSTGTMHLAVAAGTPTFTLFSGYTSAVWSAPEGPHGGVVASDWEDCRGIPVEEAYRTLLPTLEKAMASPRPRTLA
jgi:ADP-heptose:LPS heptosyltransferase